MYENVGLGEGVKMSMAGAFGRVWKCGGVTWMFGAWVVLCVVRMWRCAVLLRVVWVL